jgi:hypothetical protein
MRYLLPLLFLLACGAKAKLVPDKPKAVPKFKLLENLEVAEPKPDGYNRQDWKHWIDEDDDCQDTRQEVLIAESKVPVTFETSKKCEVAAGKWICPYTGETFTDPNKLEINHMVPLEEVNASGGSEWEQPRRKAYANSVAYRDHLVAVKSSAHLSKGGKTLDKWLPSSKKFICAYAKAWVRIKTNWKLSITGAEQAALKRGLSSCAQSKTLDAEIGQMLDNLTAKLTRLVTEVCNCRDRACMTPRYHGEFLPLMKESATVLTGIKPPKAQGSGMTELYYQYRDCVKRLASTAP